MKKKTRLDVYIFENDLATSKENAKALIMAGEVTVNGNVCIKADNIVSSSDTVIVKSPRLYVSRGAYKLEHAIKFFKIDPSGMSVLDIGISSGGFSDLLLQKGAEKITGVDVNVSQVDYKLARDERVTLVKINARYLKEQNLPFSPDLIVIDVSFISILKILETLKFLKRIPIIGLIKPQFEAEKKEVVKGGIISSEEKRLEIVLRLKHKIEALGYSVTGFIDAGIKGRKGNQEYFFLMECGMKSSISDKIVIDGIKV